MRKGPDTSNQITGIEILYNTVFDILSQTEFQHATLREQKDKIGIVKKAYSDAKELFRGEFRRDGKRYFEHLRSVTDIILKELPYPTVRKVIVAMLHDMMEDTEVDFDTLKKTFWEEIATAVNLLTKKSIDHYMEEGEEKTYVSWLSREEKDAYYKIHKARLRPFKEKNYYDDLFNSWNDDAISVKIADRMHNLRDMLGSTSAEKIQEYIDETQEYIIPGLQKFGDTYQIGISHLQAYLANLKIYLQTLGVKKDLTKALK